MFGLHIDPQSLGQALGVTIIFIITHVATHNDTTKRLTSIENKLNSHEQRMSTIDGRIDMLYIIAGSAGNISSERQREILDRDRTGGPPRGRGAGPAGDDSDAKRS